jgi:polysaccharide biosynthesis transport protein
MEQKSLQQLIPEYLDLVRRGKYFIIVPLVLSVFIGTAIAFKLPKMYLSETRIFYMQAQLPDWAKLETINMYLEAMLIFIEAMALSPDNILRLIQELELYPEIEDRVAASALLTQFKNSYNLEYNYTEIPTKYGRTEEVITGFSFSFEHSDPRKAYYVVNGLATSFIELFRKFREASSVKSSTFFEAERERLRREMAVIDQQIANFKQKHVNELPELFGLNYRMVEMLNSRLFALDQKALQLRGQQRNIENQLSIINPVLGMTGISGERIVTPQERLAALQSELGQLRARYSERHPDVLRAQHEISKLEALLAEQSETSVNDQGKSGIDTLNDFDRYVVEQAGGAFNPSYMQLLRQLEELKVEILNIERERREHEADLAEYERRLGMTPYVEKEWLVLSRDRDSAQQRFNDLASQVLTMESAAEMEKRELGGRLSIGQPPVIPLAPSKPNIAQIIGISFILGLFIGVALLLGWDYLSRTVRAPQDLLALYDSAVVLVDLPMVADNKKVAFSKYKAAYVRVAVVIVLIAAVVAVDLFYMKVDVLLIRIFALLQEKLALSGF